MDTGNLRTGQYRAPRDPVAEQVEFRFASRHGGFSPYAWSHDDFTDQRDTQEAAKGMAAPPRGHRADKRMTSVVFSAQPYRSLVIYREYDRANTHDERSAMSSRVLSAPPGWWLNEWTALGLLVGGPGYLPEPGLGQVDAGRSLTPLGGAQVDTINALGAQLFTPPGQVPRYPRQWLEAFVAAALFQPNVSLWVSLPGDDESVLDPGWQFSLLADVQLMIGLIVGDLPVRAAQQRWACSFSSYEDPRNDVALGHLPRIVFLGRSEQTGVRPTFELPGQQLDLVVGQDLLCHPDAPLTLAVRLARAREELDWQVFQERLRQGVYSAGEPSLSRRVNVLLAEFAEFEPVPAGRRQMAGPVPEAEPALETIVLPPEEQRVWALDELQAHAGEYLEVLVGQHRPGSQAGLLREQLVAGLAQRWLREQSLSYFAPEAAPAPAQESSDDRPGPTWLRYLWPFHGVVPAGLANLLLWVGVLFAVGCAVLALTGADATGAIVPTPVPTTAPTTARPHVTAARTAAPIVPPPIVTPSADEFMPPGQS